MNQEWRRTPTNYIKIEKKKYENWIPLVHSNLKQPNTGPFFKALLRFIMPP